MLFKALTFRNRLLFIFLIVFIPLAFMASGVVYFQVRKIVQAGIENELQDTTDALAGLIKTSASVSIKTRLHAIAEKNRDIAQHYYNRYQANTLSRSEAMGAIEEIFLSQSVGISGYIYCLTSKGKLDIHPVAQLKHTDVSGFEFVRQQLDIRNGYLEYDWKNPGEEKERPKALYMVYFEPFDWIISVSSYREEFYHLVDINDFRENVLSHKTGAGGYAYVLGEDGTMLLHPAIQGMNVLARPDDSNQFFKQILQEKNGKIRYFWKNPGESVAREKFVTYQYLPEYKWIVASSSYMEEVFTPLNKFRNLLIFLFIAIVLSFIGITYFISTSVAKPLVSLMKKLEKGAGGDYSVRMDEGPSDEFGKLARHFNSFMGQLEKNREQIEVEIRKNIQTRTALVENELKLRSLFNQSFQYTGILSPTGILEEINQSALEYAGCSWAQITGRPFWQAPFWRHDSRVQQQLKDAVEKAVEVGFVRYETTSMSRDNKIREIDMVIKPVFNPSGKIAFIMTESRDITELKQVARDRKNLAVQLEKSQKMEAIGTLAGGIAHDFNNILSGILGYAQLAEMTLESPAKARSYLAQIIKGAQRAADLTQQILTFSRRTDYEKRPLSLYLVVKEALKLLRSSIPSTIQITETITAKSKILADPTQMHQVIMNLCTNAYHAMEKSGGNLNVRLTEKIVSNETDIFDQEIKNGTYLELEVMDTGHGMSGDILKKAFDPYFTTKEIGKGTGFGLSVVHAIVEAHNGHIKVNTRAGEGTHFYVHLPVVSNEDMIQHADEQKEKIFQTGSERIMVVDDEEDIRIIIQEFLMACGYRVSVFEDGEKAFEAFEKDRDQFDLVITDMTMPRMTGGELAQKIFTIRKEMPIILCTGYSETVSEADALGMGIRKYLQKPFSNGNLAALIREILDQPKTAHKSMF